MNIHKNMQIRGSISMCLILTAITTGLYYKNLRILTSVSRKTVAYPTAQLKNVVRHIATHIRAGPEPIIILTYARSGSTFLGEVIRQSPGVFYVFEPLHFLTRFLTNNTLHYSDGRIKNNILFLNEAENIINNLAVCNLVDLPLEYWNMAFGKLLGIQLQTFYRTYRREVMRRFSEPLNFRSVVQRLQTECLQSKQIVIKTIRTPLSILKNMFTTLDSLKIIHLVRDPRPTLISQNGTIRKFTSVSTEASQFCMRVLSDVKTFDYFVSFYPEKIIRVRYEDLARHPVNTTRRIYEYLNFTFSIHVENNIHNMTSSGKTKEGNMSIVKGNSTELVYKWRSFVSVDFVLEVDKQCGVVYDRLGYIQIENQEMLKNTMIPLLKHLNDIRYTDKNI